MVAKQEKPTLKEKIQLAIKKEADKGLHTTNLLSFPEYVLLKKLSK